jgi:hypothetical protein
MTDEADHWEQAARGNLLDGLKASVLTDIEYAINSVEMGIPYDELDLDFLPPAFSDRYDVPFLKSVQIAAAQLIDSGLVGPPGCVVHEMLIWAAGWQMNDQEAAEWMIEDTDFLCLWYPSEIVSDLISAGPLKGANLEFGEWFKPFRSESS